MPPAIGKVAAITDAVRAAEAAMQAVCEYIRATQHPTAEAAHALIDEVLLRLDCVSPEGHIVAAAPENVAPHAVGSGPLPLNVPIVIDIFPQSSRTGYWADITRTVVKGTPSSEVRRMYEAVCAAQALAISLLAPGRAAGEIQQAVDNYFTNHGFVTTGTGTEFRFAEGFVHGVGHGVSTKIHDQPRLGRDSTDVLALGDVVTIEPGLYYPQVGGVRVEDVVLVTSTGPRVLTAYPHGLVV